MHARKRTRQPPRNAATWLWYLGKVLKPHLAVGSDVLAFSLILLLNGAEVVTVGELFVRLFVEFMVIADFVLV